MKLRYNQLSQQLQQPLAPVYLISGDEPLQAMEAADAVRASARQAGYADREVMTVETGFDWSSLAAITGNLSLFAEQRLIDLRMPTGKPGVAGSKALVAYIGQLPEDTILLIQSGKLDRSAANSAWVKAIEKAGVHVQVWPMAPAEIMGWIAARLRHKGLSADREAVQLLSVRVEGNLLAAAQEIEKLSLLHGEGKLTAQDVLSAVADSTRFNIFDLADAALQGDTVRAAKILEGLRGEDVKPSLVLWSLAEQVRSLTAMSHELAKGASFEAVSRSLWAKRKPLMKSALSRTEVAGWQNLLRRCAHVDRVIKGQARGRPWDELLQLTLGVAGKPALS